MANLKKSTELIVALDVNETADAEQLVETLDDYVSWYKVGKQFFTQFGPAAVKLLKERGKKVFLDLKYHDIPNTVAQAVRAAGDIGANMVNVHAAGGPQMLQAAAAAAAERDLLVVAVTVLTSLSKEDLQDIGVENVTVEQQVLRLARLTQSNGVAGVVCSAHEIAVLKKECGADFKLVVPGIRPAGNSAHDQKRVMTPAQAAAAGADYIVVGRPITQADDPAAAARAIVAELKMAAE